jgi:DNA modification methylase
MDRVSDASIDLIVTSPPYPMIEMWDDLFTRLDPRIHQSIRKGEGLAAFELMHAALDSVWTECGRVLRPGGIACINIGDAVRTLDGNFVLYPNHARILQALLKIGLAPLPAVIWRKQTNAPNKFMGSGMLPPGAYVTLEHEYVLIARKGEKREFLSAEKKRRRHESAFFWEERNNWFSDVWMDLKGARQNIETTQARQRSAAFPFELPFRLIQMFSVAEDTVLDPFLGTGTSAHAAMATGRNSIGFEVEKGFREAIRRGMDPLVGFANQLIRSRLENHVEFVESRMAEKGALKHRNQIYGFPVVTSQEKLLRFHELIAIRAIDEDAWQVDYLDQSFRTCPETVENAGNHAPEKLPPDPKKMKKPRQIKLLD